jgi:hypothetical protein
LLTFKDEKIEPRNKCVYDISHVELTKVNKVQVFFGDLHKIIKCEYGGRKNQIVQKACRASIQHGGSIDYNIGKIKCHHFK